MREGGPSMRVLGDTLSAKLILHHMFQIDIHKDMLKAQLKAGDVRLRIILHTIF